MLSLCNITKQYGSRILFAEASLTIGPQDRIGLVGPNGAGKSTLFSVITGEEQPDSGQVARATQVLVGHLAQELSIPSDKTVLQEVLSVADHVNTIEHQLRLLEEEMAAIPDGPEHLALLEKYGDLQHRFEQAGGYNIESDAKKILAGMGFKEKDFSRAVSQFSGGWLMRMAMCKLFLSAPDLLLLDEPTNHLDLETVIWLEGFLQNYSGAVLLISHDRVFLNKVVNRVVEIDNRRLVAYTGNYDEFLEARELNREIMEASRANQQKKIQQTQDFIDRFRAKATKARQVQSRVKMLEKIDRIETEQERRKVKFQFPPPPRSGEVVAEAKELGKRYGDNIVYTDLNLTIQRGDKIAFVGPNGAGKSTLLKILADAIPHDSGELKIGHNVSRAYFAQHQLELLNERNTVLQEMAIAAPDQGQTFWRTILGSFLFSGDDVDKKVGVLSGGERCRLAMAKMLVRPANFLLLDEPTNHLDIQSRDVLEEALESYEGTFCLITHDRHLIQSVANKIVEVNNGKATVYPGDYEYYLYKKGLEGQAEEKTGGKPKSEGKTAVKQAEIVPELPASAAESVAKKSKEQKRAEAEARNRLHKQTAGLRDRIKKLEDEIEEKTARSNELSTLLADPSLYQNQPKFFSTMEEYESIKRKLERLNDEWEKESLKLEEAEQAAG
ncbi:MAG: ATP-binding cassette domain-containing protein [Nitrospirota bacterium]|nr:ATP-binding cassette domain-containing protein [Nitrospirota bacterium]